MIRNKPGRAAALCAALLFLAAAPAVSLEAQWAAGPGETARNAFGPLKHSGASACRGACGADCPSSCEQDVRYECAPGGRLLRVQALSCGTHPACRAHDDCLDRCAQEHGEGYDCQAECHVDVMSDYPVEMAASWAAGGGPYQGDPILFEYTMDQPGGAEAFYRCPRGASLQCAGERAACEANGKSVEPVFANYEGGKAGAMRISAFRSGRVCTQAGQPSKVCLDAIEIPVSGNDRCNTQQGVQRCTWYGFEFDYSGATPGEPLYCQSSADEGDFLGEMVGQALKSVDLGSDSELNEAVGEDLGALLGGLQKELNSGKSLDQVFSGITMTTADGQTFGGKPQAETFATPGVPGEIAVNGSSGHLFVPMFEVFGGESAAAETEHHVRCMQAGQPVVETTFRLRASL